MTHTTLRSISCVRQFVFRCMLVLFTLFFEYVEGPMTFFEYELMFFAYDLYDIAVVVKSVLEPFHNRTDVTWMWSVVAKMFCCMGNPIGVAGVRYKEL